MQENISTLTKPLPQQAPLTKGMKVYHSIRELSKGIDSQVQESAVKQEPTPKFA